MNKLNPSTNTKTIKLFLGAIQYEVHSKLTQRDGQHETILKKSKKWQWTEERNTDFKTLKKN